MRKSLCIGLTLFVLGMGYSAVSYSADATTQETDATSQKKMKKNKKPSLKKRDAKDLGSSRPSQPSDMKSESTPKTTP